MMSAEQSVLTAILLCVGGAVLTLLVSRSKTVAGWIAFIVTTLSAVFILRAVWKVLTTGAAAHAAEFWSMPQAGFGLRLYVDGLTAVFLLLSAVIAVAAALYSITYVRHYSAYGVARFYPYLLLFVGGIYGLLSTTDMMWFFFIFWQMMTLPSYALIRFEYKKSENIRAANKYLVLMQIACAAVMSGTALLARGSSLPSLMRYDFDAVSRLLPAVLHEKPAVATFAFALFLIGFGIKAGMWPFGQIWLPDAHPAAPSPVSAMLSGVMIKTGVYGLLRSFLWLVPMSAQQDYPLANWGIVISVLGTITLFTGTMEALRQDQSKRLLAFSSIGQVGYMLFAAGACMCLLAFGSTSALSLATIAFMGALLHVLNHGLFKALLFLNAGSMLQATGTQDLNKMGGLMKFMPITGVTVLIASLSIAGVPLTNGFVSKWAILVSGIQAAPYAGFLPLCAVIGILTSALTLAVFIKFFGASFLSRTSDLVRTRVGSRELEAPWTMQIPQVCLASFCVVLGLLPALSSQVVQRAMQSSRQGFGIALAENIPIHSGILEGLSESTTTARLAPLLLTLLMAATFGVAYAISRVGQPQRRAAAPWLCGYAREAECHRYVARNFFVEIKRILNFAGNAQLRRGRT